MAGVINRMAGVEKDKFLVPSTCGSNGRPTAGRYLCDSCRSRIAAALISLSVRKRIANLAKHRRTREERSKNKHRQRSRHEWPTNLSGEAGPKAPYKNHPVPPHFPLRFNLRFNQSRGGAV